MARVFISSTTEDLKEHRAVARDMLRARQYDVVAFEAFEASPDEAPLEQSRAAIESCDLFVGIVAWRYGFIPTRDNPEGRSFVELEFRHAWRLGKPTLIFILKEDFPWPPRFVDSGER